jgi:hypothetical protein
VERSDLEAFTEALISNQTLDLHTETKAMLYLVHRVPVFDEYMFSLVMREVETFIFSGAGAKPLLRPGAKKTDGIDDDDVAILSDLLYGQGSAQGLLINEEEALYIVGIAQKAGTTPTSAEWPVFFRKILFNFLFLNNPKPESYPDSKKAWVETHLPLVAQTLSAIEKEAAAFS